MNWLIFGGVLLFLVGCSKNNPVNAILKGGVIPDLQKGPPSQPGTANIPLFVAGGQSQMVGIGQYTASVIGPEIIWRGLDFPRGPAVAFVEDYLRRTGRSQAIIVQTAVGDTSMEQWSPGGALYSQALQLVQNAKAEFPSAQVTAILWYQGENDAKLPSYPWAAKFTELMKALRGALGDSQIPVIFCQIDNYLSPLKANYPGWANIQAEQASVQIPNSAMVGTSDVIDFAPDGMHIQANGLRQIGERMADAYFGLLQ